MDDDDRPHAVGEHPADRHMPEVCRTASDPHPQGEKRRKERSRDGLAASMTGFTQPITNRMRSEENMRQASRDWKATFDAINDAICLLDRDGRILRLNDGMRTLLDLPEEKVVGRKCQEAMSLLGTPFDDSLFRKMLESRKRESHELVIAGKLYRTTADPTFDGDGNIAGVVYILRDITQFKHTALALEERLRFEKMLADLSASFVNLPSERIQEVIDDSLKMLVEVLGHDRSTIAEFTSDKGQALVTHSYTLPGIISFPVNAIADNRLPWYVEQIRRGKICLFKRLPDDCPPEAAEDRQFCIAQGIKSNLSIPLVVGGSVLGVITFTFLRRFCDWQPEIVDRLQLVADVFANALVRKRTGETIREADELNRAVLSSMPDSIGVLDAEGMIVGVNPAWKEFASSNLSKDDPTGPGINYLQACERTARSGDEHARSALEGISAVLAGQRPTFSLEFPSVAPGPRRWFLMTVVPLRSGRKGVVVSHKDVTALKEVEIRLRDALGEVEALKERLERENTFLREQVILTHKSGKIIGQSDALKKVLSEAERVAVTDAPVLLLGETGTGKELLAQAIHELSPRKERPMVIVNCASLPGTLIESELFGREAGAYTGAVCAQIGRFEAADRSTLFLDEVGELPLELQTKLLRVLEDGRFERLGSPKTITVDVRIIAATNRDLEGAVRDGKFRSDLYHRLNVFPISIPPLRQRREDIPMLVWAFVEASALRMGRTIKRIPRRTMEGLQGYSWPGNVRELSNVIERAMILSTGDTLQVDVPSLVRSGAASGVTLKDHERQLILEVLEETGWRIRGANGAAEILGVKPTTLEARMARLGIKRGGRDSNPS